MAKKKKSGSQGIQAIKAKQRAKKLASRAKNRQAQAEFKSAVNLIKGAEKAIAKGYDEGFVYVGQYSPSMTFKEKMQLAKSGELNPMKIRQSQELGLHGNTGIGARGNITETLLPSGIKRSQINKNRPEAFLLGTRWNTEAPKVPYSEDVHTSTSRASNLMLTLKALQKVGIVDEGKIKPSNVYEQRINLKALEDYYWSADEAERQRISELIRDINERPEMSQTQYDYWRQNTMATAEALGTTEQTLRFAEVAINTTGLFEAAKASENESEQVREAQEMTAFIANNSQYWDNEFKSELQAKIDNEDFGGALEMLKQKGYRPKNIK